MQEYLFICLSFVIAYCKLYHMYISAAMLTELVGIHCDFCVRLARCNYCSFIQCISTVAGDTFISLPAFPSSFSTRGAGKWCACWPACDGCR